MISWWPAEGDANDIQGGNDGMPVGTVTFVPGEVGQAFNFDGASGFENMGTPGSLDLTNTLTLDGWINPNDSTKNGVYFGKANSGQNDYALFLLGDLTGCIKTSDGIEHFLHTGFVPPAGQWTHVALVYDGSNEIVYANGIEIGRQAVSGSIRSEGIPFFIGGRQGDSPANSLYINARIDEVEVFNRALTGAEILSIHNAACTGKCRSCAPAPAGMISWWPGNGNGNDVQDGNNLTFNPNGFGYGSGKVGQAFNFNGSQFLTAGNPANLDITGDQVTIDAWVNPSVDMTNEVIFFGKRADGFQYMLEWNAGSLAGRVNNGNVEAVYTPPTGTWTHLALVYDGS